MAVEIRIYVYIDDSENGSIPVLSFFRKSDRACFVATTITAPDGTEAGPLGYIRVPCKDEQARTLNPFGVWRAAEFGRYGLAFRPTGETEVASG